eukprot:s3256_g10.t1
MNGGNRMGGNGMGGNSMMMGEEDMGDDDLAVLQDDAVETAPVSTAAASSGGPDPPVPKQPASVPLPLVQYNKNDDAAITCSASMLRGGGVPSSHLPNEGLPYSRLSYLLEKLVPVLEAGYTSCLTQRGLLQLLRLFTKLKPSRVASYDDLDLRFKNALDRIQALQADFPDRLLARLPLAISDTDVNELAVEEGWNDDFLRGGPLRPPPTPASGNIRNAFGNAVTAPAVPPKLPPVPRGVVALPAPILPKAPAAAPGVPVRGVPAATPEPAASIPAAPVVPPAPTALPAAPVAPPPVSGAAFLFEKRWQQ